MKRAIVIAVTAFASALVAILVFQHLSEPGAGLRQQSVVDMVAQVRHGAYLAKAGNCMACHTTLDGAPYAGGKALDTPFGTMYGPNLTPDLATGIGAWSADDFWRAMHNGKSKDGSFLYPAFPYPNYTKVQRADSDAIYAYLRTLAPVRQANLEHALRFPYNQRELLAFWRMLYFTPGQYQPDAARDVQWNRGAYLVQGLGHCSACHATRNAVGATLAAERLGGGIVGNQGWHASPLGGLGDAVELSALLQDGVSDRDAVAGPMAQVVAGSLQFMNQADIAAIASYLVTVPEPRDRAPAISQSARTGAAPVLQRGGAIYAKQCASCHGEQGEGAPRVYPRLAGTQNGQGSNAVRMVLDGGYAPSTSGNPRPHGMPPFGALLTDAEIAAVLSFVNTSWGNRGPLIQPHEVDRLRAR